MNNILPTTWSGSDLISLPSLPKEQLFHSILECLSYNYRKITNINAKYMHISHFKNALSTLDDQFSSQIHNNEVKIILQKISHYFEVNIYMLKRRTHDTVITDTFMCLPESPTMIIVESHSIHPVGVQQNGRISMLLFKSYNSDIIAALHDNQKIENI